MSQPQLPIAIGLSVSGGVLSLPRPGFHRNHDCGSSAVSLPSPQHDAAPAIGCSLSDSTSQCVTQQMR